MHMDHEDHVNPSPIRTLLRGLVSSCLMSRRLEDRIRELCALAVSYKEPAEMEKILPVLKEALHQQVDRMRNLASQRPLPSERRYRLS